MPPFSLDPAPPPPQPANGTPRTAGRHTVAIAPPHRLDLNLGVLDGPDGRRTLTARQCAILYWAGHHRAECGLPLDAIAGRTGLDIGEVLEHLAPLAAAGALALRPAEPGIAGPAPDETDRLPALWGAAVAAHAGRPFLMPAGGSPLSYAAAGRRVDAIARRLAAAGLSRGARVAVHAEPNLDAALLFWACARLGAVFVPVDSAWSEAAFLKALGLVEPALVFADPPRAAAARASGRAAVVFDGPNGPAAEPPARGFADWLASGGHAGPLPDETRETDTAVVLFTSGTTGAPKGVELSHGSLVRSARLLAEVCGLTAEDRLLSVAEFHTVSGLRNPLVLAAARGAAAVLPAGAERHHPPALARRCARDRVTVLAAVPAGLKALGAASGRIEAGALSGLRLVLSTGAELPPAAVERLRAVTGAPVMTYYGLTETGGVCTVGAAGIAEGAIGVPAGALVQIVDPDGTPLPPGKAGELRVYTANRMTGHYRRPDLDAARLRDGWVYTGDLGVRREDGTILLTGRGRDILKTARGDLLPLADIDRLLERDPAVLEAVACAVRDGNGEERALAFVRLADGQDPTAAVERLKRRALDCLGHRAAPLDIRVRDDFPRAANGKVRRRALLEEPDPDARR